MDDRTLIICAATLCVVGVALTQVLGTNAMGRSEPQLASVNVIDKVKLGALGGRAADAFAAPKTLPPAR